MSYKSIGFVWGLNQLYLNAGDLIEIVCGFDRQRPKEAALYLGVSGGLTKDHYHLLTSKGLQVFTLNNSHIVASDILVCRVITTLYHCFECSPG